MRVGEACRLLFKDYDFERMVVRVTPEKHSRARELKLSDKLVSMLKLVYGQYPDSPLPDERNARRYLERTRKFLAVTENNPRFLNIHLHSFRHFRATMLYHQTKDILYVQRVLGHKAISNTLRYTQLVEWEASNNWICKVARTIEEAGALIERGFEYVTEMEGMKLFRKRK